MRLAYKKLKIEYLCIFVLSFPLWIGSCAPQIDPSSSIENAVLSSASNLKSAVHRLSALPPIQAAWVQGGTNAQPYLFNYLTPGHFTFDITRPQQQGTLSASFTILADDSLSYQGKIYPADSAIKTDSFEEGTASPLVLDFLYRPTDKKIGTLTVKIVDDLTRDTVSLSCDWKYKENFGLDVWSRTDFVTNNGGSLLHNVDLRYDEVKLISETWPGPDGTVPLTPNFRANVLPYIPLLQKRGQVVLLTTNTVVHWPNEFTDAMRTNYVSSLEQILQQTGADGLDLDLENDFVPTWGSGNHWSIGIYDWQGFNQQWPQTLQLVSAIREVMAWYQSVYHKKMRLEIDFGLGDFLTGCTEYARNESHDIYLGFAAYNLGHVFTSDAYKMLTHFGGLMNLVQLLRDDIDVLAPQYYTPSTNYFVVPHDASLVQKSVDPSPYILSNNGLPSSVVVGYANLLAKGYYNYAGQYFQGFSPDKISNGFFGIAQNPTLPAF